MLYRVDPKMGKKLSALGLGCMRFPRSFEDTEKMIVKAVESGINYFDTAYIYGGSEETLGTVLQKNKLREKVNITTKLPIVFCKNGEDFDKYFDKQLERLKTDYVDYFLLHMLQDKETWDKLAAWGIVEWVEKQKASGRIRQFGFSFHGRRHDFEELLEVYPWEICMIQYNYLDENYQAGKVGLRKAAGMGIPVVVMEPLLGGRLATGLPKGVREIFGEVNKFRTPAGWGLRWLWDQPEVVVVLSGMSSMAQLEENMGEVAEAGCLSDDEKECYLKVREVFGKTYKVRCTGCNYCMPCPKGVDIPSCFSAHNASYSIGFVEGVKQYFMSTGATSVKRGNAALCIECGKCEKHCPQEIGISQELKKVRKRLEPWWARGAIKIARTFLGVDKKGNA